MAEPVRAIRLALAIAAQEVPHLEEPGYLTRVIAEDHPTDGNKGSHEQRPPCQKRHGGIVVGAGLLFPVGHCREVRRPGGAVRVAARLDQGGELHDEARTSLRTQIFVPFNTIKLYKERKRNGEKANKRGKKTAGNGSPRVYTEPGHRGRGES